MREAPGLDHILVFVTPTIERDYIEREAFPELWSGKAIAQRAASIACYVSPDTAMSIMADAKLRVEEVRGPLRRAYGSHVSSLETAIEQAAKRCALYAATSAVQTGKWESRHEWVGTKEQLIAQGFILSGPWPMEPGAKKWAKGTDAAGHSVHITRYVRDQPANWPTLYEARFWLHGHEILKPRDPKQERDLGHALSELHAMPKNSEDFLWKLVDDVRYSVAAWLQCASTPSEFHGYTIEQHCVEDILMQMDDLLEAIVQADVLFDQGRQDARKSKLQADIARLDGAFQKSLAAMTKPNPRLLVGASS